MVAIPLTREHSDAHYRLLAEASDSQLGWKPFQNWKQKQARAISGTKSYSYEIPIEVCLHALIPFIKYLKRNYYSNTETGVAN